MRRPGRQRRQLVRDGVSEGGPVGSGESPSPRRSGRDQRVGAAQPFELPLPTVATTDAVKQEQRRTGSDVFSDKT